MEGYLRFQTDFEKYKEVFRRMLRKRRANALLRDSREVIDIEEFRIIHIPEESPVPSIHDLVEMDEKWLEEVTKFTSYPSGNIALIISHTEESDAFTYMIFKDEEKLSLQALINNLGHATFYDKEEGIKMCMGLNFGFYFDEKGRQKVWNWWDPNQHVHAPPYQSIYFDLNPCVAAHIKTQDKVFITFSYYKQKIHLNLGTKVKVKDSETELKLQNKPILETHKLQEQFQKINSLLKKMKGLCCLTKADLETFLKGYPSMSKVEKYMRAGELIIMFENPSRGSVE